MFNGLHDAGSSPTAKRIWSWAYNTIRSTYLYKLCRHPGAFVFFGRKVEETCPRFCRLNREELGWLQVQSRNQRIFILVLGKHRHSTGISVKAFELEASRTTDGGMHFINPSLRFQTNDCIVWYRIALYCIVLYRNILYCSVCHGNVCVCVKTCCSCYVDEERCGSVDTMYPATNNNLYIVVPNVDRHWAYLSIAIKIYKSHHSSGRQPRNSNLPYPSISYILYLPPELLNGVRSKLPKHRQLPSDASQAHLSTHQFVAQNW